MTFRCLLRPGLHEFNRVHCAHTSARIMTQLSQQIDRLRPLNDCRIIVDNFVYRSHSEFLVTDRGNNP